VTVLSCLIRDERHQALLGVLLFDDVLALATAYLTAEKEGASRVERVVEERIFRTEQLRRKTQAWTNEAPRRCGFGDEGVAFVVNVFHGGAGKVFRRPLEVIDVGAVPAPKLFGVVRAYPFEPGDLRGDLDGSDAVSRSTRLGEEEASNFNAVAHHVEQHAAT